MSLLYEAIDFSYSMAEDELPEPLQLKDLEPSPEPKSDVKDNESPQTEDDKMVGDVEVSVAEDDKPVQSKDVEPSLDKKESPRTGNDKMVDLSVESRLA